MNRDEQFEAMRADVAHPALRGSGDGHRPQGPGHPRRGAHLHRAGGDDRRVRASRCATTTTWSGTTARTATRSPRAPSSAPLMAELMGRRTGVCQGKGGSMHLADFQVGSLGETAIVGPGIPQAAGAAYSARVRGTDQVALCFFGDGGGEHRVVPRGPEPGVGLEPRRGVRLREQPVRDVDADRRHDGVRQHRRARRGLPHARRDRRRAGRGGGVRRGEHRGRPGPLGRGAHADRGPHVPLPRPCRVRQPQSQPPRRGGVGAMADARPDPPPRRPPARERRQRRASWTRSRRRGARRCATLSSSRKRARCPTPRSCSRTCGPRRWRSCDEDAELPRGHPGGDARGDAPRPQRRRSSARTPASGRCRRSGSSTSSAPTACP